nr:MAG TPA: hypothetical protein [Caudoviricetes sp.]
MSVIFLYRITLHIKICAKYLHVSNLTFIFAVSINQS